MEAAFNYKYEVFNPIFERFNNEALYDALCAATAPLNEGLKELANRMNPIVLSAARGFLNALSWTFDDAKDEALILIWELIRKRTYKAGGAPFHNFFSRCYQLRLNDKFAKTVKKNPVLMGNCKIGMTRDKPIEVCGYGWHPKAEDYRRKDAERQARYTAKKKAEREAQQPKKPQLTEEEKHERALQKSRAKFAALTPEQKRAKYDRENAARKAKYAAMSPEEKAAVRARYAGYARARKARQAAQASA